MTQRYSKGAMLLHWLLAFALMFQLSLGLGLEYLGARGFAQFQLHKSVGITILLLSLLRLVWRFAKPRPEPIARGWQGMLAGVVHLGLYLFMIGAPLTGWLLVSTEKVRVPTLLFATIPWPHLPVPNSLNPVSHGTHALLSWLGLALILLHIIAALHHQWILRDGLLARMAPGRSARSALALALLVPLGWALGVVAIKSAGTPPQATTAPALIVAPAPGPASPAKTETAEPLSNESNAAAPAQAEGPPAWTIQPGGTLAFSLSNGGDMINGQFAKWSGTIRFDPDHPERADITIRVNLASASVGDATQDAMLASPDFFDAASRSTAIFTTKTVRRTGPNRYSADGTLRLKGMSGPQSIAFTLKGSDQSRHVEGSAMINRTSFGVGTGPSGETLSPEVSLTFSFNARSMASDKVEK